MSRLCRIKAGITIGDPSGIGPAVTVKAINRLAGKADFVVIGDCGVLSKVPGFTGLLKGKVRIIDLNNVAINRFRFGKIKAEYGRASIEYLDKSLELLKNKEIECLITCPISKDAVNRAGFKISGHTEYFIKKTKSASAEMMLLNKYLRFTLATRHLSLKDVPDSLSIESICRAALVTHQSLKEIFRIPYPRIAICALNPHGSDNGLLGCEEEKIIKPALARIKKKINGVCDGPFPADTAIQMAFNREYDAVIAMYHDQALIPLKVTGADSGVNITLGLDFIRTSPLHGTAFDIAGNNGTVDPGSLISAIELALKCASSRKKT